MKCEECAAEIEPDDMFEHQGRQLCEDCYLDALTPAKPCDPWAVHLASRAIHMDASPISQQLTERQNSIIEYINSSGKVTLEDIREHLGLQESELMTEIATLRHCNLLTGSKENGIIYFVSTQ